MYQMILLRGLLCSGKKDMATQIAEGYLTDGHEVPIFSAMDYFQTKAGFIYRNHELSHADQWMFQSCKEYMEKEMPKFATDVTIVAYSCLPLRKDVDRFRLLCQEHGVKFTLLEVHGSAALRNGVNELMIDKMRSQWEPMMVSM